MLKKIIPYITLLLLALGLFGCSANNSSGPDEAFTFQGTTWVMEKAEGLTTVRLDFSTEIEDEVTIYLGDIRYGTDAKYEYIKEEHKLIITTSVYVYKLVVDEENGKMATMEEVFGFGRILRFSRVG